MQYICTGNKPNTTRTRCVTITATSARDAFLAFTKGDYVENVSIIAIAKDLTEERTYE